MKTHEREAHPLKPSQFGEVSPPSCRLGSWFLKMILFPVLLLAGTASAGTVTANFTSATSIPVSYPALDATGLQIAFNLLHTPVYGADLTAVEITGLNRITGRFANLVQGQEVTLSHGGFNFGFFADYHGGSGNDLVLRWLRRGVSSWGNNAGGQLGVGQFMPIKIPVDVTHSGALSGKKVTSVSAGAAHALALCSDGTLVAWGNNASGQLGTGNNVTSNVPVAVNISGVLAGRTVVSISAGGSHSLALCSDGTIAAWGLNTDGRLGIGTTVATNVPMRVIDSGVLLGKNPVAVSAGSTHSLALCSDGTVTGWGTNSSGELGNNDSVASSSPVVVDSTGVLAARTVVSISAGTNLSLGLCSDGRVAAWGANNTGQLGDGASETQSVPVLVSDSGVLSGMPVSSVSAGAGFALAIRSDGAAVAWGSNSSGQLGNDSTTPSNVPVLVDSSAVLAGRKVVSVTTGTGFAVAACSDGAVAAWGGNTSSQLGNNSGAPRITPVLVSGFGALAGRVTGLVDSGTSFSVAVSTLPPSTELGGLVASEGTLSPAASPGVTEYFLRVNGPSPGFAITVTANDFSPIRINGAEAVSGTPFPLTIPNGSSSVMIQVGVPGGTVSNYRLTILSGESLDASFGSASDIPLQGGGFDLSGIAVNFSLGFLPPLGTNLTVVRNVSPGFISGTFSGLSQGQEVDLAFGGKIYHFVANYYGGSGNDLVLEWARRSIAGWGRGNYGQIGIMPIQIVPAPAAMADLGVLTGKTVTSVAAGANHSLALCADGTLAVWGGGASYILGAGGTLQSTVPISVKTSGALAGKNVVAISAANVNSVAVCSDGSAVAWGDGFFGQLGNGGTGDANEPVAVSLTGGLAAKSIVSVAVGGFHCLAVCSDGSVVSWGRNDQGQLGDGTTTDRNVPVLVSTGGVLAGKTVVAVSAGFEYSLALCSDGKLAAWGRGDSYQLSADSTAKSLVPLAVNQSGVLAAKTVIALSQASHSTPTVLCSDGTVVTWGLNNKGQRGNTATQPYAPAVVTVTGALAGKSVSHITSGGSSSLAVCADGAVVTWGDNNSGQLGNAGFSTSAAPVAVTDNGILTGAKPLFAALAGHAIVVSAESSEGYRGWAFELTDLAQKAAFADPDFDGIPNLLEYVLLGDPVVSSTSILPALSEGGSDFVFNFNRLATSAADTTQIFQYSPDMIQWTDVRITAPTDSQVGSGPVDESGNQSVTVTVPKGGNRQMFGRLQVARP